MTARNHAATLVNRGILRQRRGAYEDALSDFREAREYVDDLPQAWIGEGNVAFLTQDFAAALYAYNQALESDLEEAHALHFNRGLALERLNRRDEAAEAYRAALALSPGWVAAEARLYRLENPEDDE